MPVIVQTSPSRTCTATTVTKRGSLEGILMPATRIGFPVMNPHLLPWLMRWQAAGPSLRRRLRPLWLPRHLCSIVADAFKVSNCRDFGVAERLLRVADNRRLLPGD